MATKELCQTQLKEAELHKLQDAIEDLYYFEFVIGVFHFVCLQLACCVEYDVLDTFS